MVNTLETICLFDALSNGFVSVEADIWLYPDDGELRVAHAPVADPTTLPTLEELYLDPLQELHEEFDGGVYADGTPLTLLINLKSEGLPTYQQLDEVLAEYQEESPGLFTTYIQDETGDYTMTPGAVTPIISGDRPREYMESQEVRYAGYDGRKDVIGTDVDPGFMPLISDNWDNFFTGELAWDGTGTIPEDTEAELNDIVAEVQEEDKMLRFWNLPQDAPSVWEPLYEAGVDLINPDDLEGLSAFIESQLAGDRLVGGDGDDRFFAQMGGDNTITGGEGEDQFWIAVTEIPEGVNTITDFKAGTDVIGIAGFDADFGQLDISGQDGSAAIAFNGNDLAYLDGIEANSLTTADFAFIAVDKTHRTLNSLKARVKPVIESMPKPYSYDLRQKVINASS